MTPTMQSLNRFRTTHLVIEGAMLKDHISNEDLRKWTKVDVIDAAAKLKWSWYGSHKENERWTKNIIHWRPREHKSSMGSPSKRWLEDIKANVWSNCHQIAQNRQDTRRWERKKTRRSPSSKSLSRKYTWAGFISVRKMTWREIND